MINIMRGINPFDAPRDFLCPISLDLMLDPVILHTGHTYDRKSIQRWLDAGHQTCPITMQRLSDLSLTPNHMLRRLITECLEQSRLKQKKQEEEVIEMLVNALQQSSTFQSAEKLKEIRIILSENDQFIKGRIMVHEAGWGALLVSMLMKPGVSEEISLEIMSILVQLRLDLRAKKDLGEAICVCRLLDFLNLHGKVEARKNAAKILASVDAISISGLMRFESRVESGLKCLLEERCTMGEGLNLLKGMVMNCSDKKDIIMERWVMDKGFVSTMVELLPGLSTQLCEVALEIINKIICSNYGDAEGSCRISMRTIVSNLTAVLMKAASDKCKLYAVLILLALCKHDHQPKLHDNYDHNDHAAHNPRDYDHNSESEYSGILIGAAHHHPNYLHVIPISLPTKLLLVLQSNCSPAVKKHCAELLKLLLAPTSKQAPWKNWLS